eukprot:SAG31_NODE_2141_length_6344_cov_13.577742_8_plen_234_part_00
MAGQTDCSKAPTGWKLADGQLQAPQNDGSDSLCVGSQQFMGCPPTTRAGGVSGCGLVLLNCSEAPTTWLADGANGALALNSSKDGQKCLFADAGQPVNGSQGRKSSTVGLQSSNQCRQSLKLGSELKWTFTASGKLQSESGICLSVDKTPGPELWSKPINASAVAVLVVNPISQPQSFSMPLTDVPGITCGATNPCAVRNVWKQANADMTQGSSILVTLAPHESAYMILSSKY